MALTPRTVSTSGVCSQIDGSVIVAEPCVLLARLIISSGVIEKDTKIAKTRTASIGKSEAIVTTPKPDRDEPPFPAALAIPIPRDRTRGTVTGPVVTAPQSQASPSVLASSSSATPLGAIGIATSGAPIFNDSEGNGDVSLGVIQGFDRNGAHTGPQTYHYHLEPEAISYDDDSLVGIMSDGFFIYGRRCYSSVDYPTDLDESNGHTAITQFTGSDAEDAEYHYHISGEQYLNGDYYLIFPGNFQGFQKKFLTFRGRVRPARVPLRS